MSGELVFVTGAAAFLGGHVVLEALKAGYRVRGSVRREAQIESLKEYFGPKFGPKVEFVILRDITEPGAYDGLLDGVAYVFHVASPLPGKSTQWKKDYIEPAVNGTTTILEAAAKISSIKKVVITGSIADLLPSSGWPAPEEAITEDHKYELDANPDLDFETPFAAYVASKILAAKAAREFYDQKKPQFSIVSVHPTFIFGANILQKSPDEISGTPAYLWYSLKGPEQRIPTSNSVHVADVAEAQIKALRPDITGYQKFLLSDEPGYRDWQDVLDFVKEKYPGEQWGNAPAPSGKWNLDVSKAERVLGMVWRDWKQQVIDTVEPQLRLIRKTRGNL